MRTGMTTVSRRWLRSAPSSLIRACGRRCSRPAWPLAGAARGRRGRRGPRRRRGRSDPRPFLIQALSLQSTIATPRVSAVPGARRAWSTARATRARAPRRLGATVIVVWRSARVSGCAKNASSASVACTSVRPPTSTPDTVTPSGTVGSCAPTGDAATSMTTRAPRIPAARPTVCHVRARFGATPVVGVRWSSEQGAGSARGRRLGRAEALFGAERPGGIGLRSEACSCGWAAILR